jgi:hypothetical protein
MGRSEKRLRRQATQHVDDVKPGDEDRKVVRIHPSSTDNLVEFGKLSAGQKFVFPKVPGSPDGSCPHHTKIVPESTAHGLANYHIESTGFKGWITNVMMVIPVGI